jgi:hypothetical protein
MYSNLFSLVHECDGTLIIEHENRKNNEVTLLPIYFTVLVISIFLLKFPSQARIKFRESKIA